MCSRGVVGWGGGRRVRIGQFHDRVTSAAGARVAGAWHPIRKCSSRGPRKSLEVAARLPLGEKLGGRRSVLGCRRRERQAKGAGTSNALRLSWNGSLIYLQDFRFIFFRGDVPGVVTLKAVFALAA